LIGQAPIKGLIASFVGGAIPRRGLERRDIYGVSRINENRDKLRVGGTSFVQLCENRAAFPRGTKTISRGFFPEDPTVVCGGTNTKHEVRVANLPEHPAVPPFGRRSLVLVDYAIDAVSPQAVRKRQHRGRVLLRVLAVTEEDSWCRNLGVDHLLVLRFPELATRPISRPGTIMWQPNHVHRYSFFHPGSA
jgi:hypothetical protein